MERLGTPYTSGKACTACPGNCTTDKHHRQRHRFHRARPHFQPKKRRHWSRQGRHRRRKRPLLHPRSKLRAKNNNARPQRRHWRSPRRASKYTSRHPLAHPRRSPHRSAHKHKTKERPMCTNACEVRKLIFAFSIYTYSIPIYQSSVESVE